MSKTVDERVVEMDFDNRKFESNVKTTMTTLDKLKHALNLDGASKGLENIDNAAKNINLDGIASGVEALNKRFSVMGIVGMTAVAKITNSMMNLAAKTTSFLTNGVIQGGITRAMNLENAHFQLQGLLKDEEAVSAVMKNVSDSVDGTAYSLDAAAKVASQLAASGMRAGDDMYKSLRAVAGVAAMTNSSYEEIGRIFTQVAGQGRLMGNDLLQLSGRGMNAAATLADYLGTTEGEVRDMVSKGKIDFQTFANAMDDAFGEHAKKANESFTGAMSNVKAALGRIGAEFVSPLIAQNGPLVQFFNTLRERINDIKSIIGPFAEAFTGAVTKVVNAASNGLKSLAFTGSDTSWSELSKKITDVGVSLDDFKSKLIETAKEHGVAVDEMISETGSFEASLKKGWLTTNIFTETLGKFASSSKQVSASTEDLNAKLRYFQDVVDKVWNGDFKNAPERYELLAEAGYDYQKVQSLVNKTVDGHRLTLEDLGEEQLKSIGYTDEQIQALNELKKQAEETGTPLNKLIEDLSKPSDKEMFITGFKNVLEDIGKILETVKDAWDAVFKSDDKSNGTFIHNFAEGFYDLTNNIRITDETLANLSTTLKGFFSVIDLGLKLGGGIFGFISGFAKILMNIFHVDLLGLTAKIAEVIIKFREWILQDNELVKSLTALRDKLVDLATNAVEIFINRLSELGDIFGTFINDLKLSEGFSLDNIMTAFSNLWSNLKIYFSNFSGIFSNLKSTIVRFLNDILDHIGVTSGSLRDFINDMSWENFLKLLTDIGEAVRNFDFGQLLSGAGGNIIDGLVDGIKDGSGKVIEAITFIGQKVIEAFCALLGIHSPSTEFFEFGRNIIEGLINGLQSMIEPLWSFIKSIGQGIIDMFDSIDWGVVITVAAGVGVFSVFNKIANALESFGEAAKNITSPLKAFSGAVAKVGNAISTKIKAEAVKSFAISIAILAGSIFLLAQLDIGKAWNAVAIIVVMSAVIGGLAFALSKINGKLETLDAAKIAATLISLGAALILFAATMKIISSMSWEDMGKAAVGIAGMTAVVAALIAISKFPGIEAQIEQVSKMVGKIAIALLAMTAVAKLIATMSWEDIGKAGAGIAGLSAIIVGLIVATKLAGTGEQAESIGNTILAVAGAIAALVIVGKLIAGMSWEDMGKAAIGIGFLSAIVVGLIAATKMVSNRYLPQIGATILAVGAAIALLAVTARLISGMSLEAMGKAAVGIGFLSAIVVGLIAATRLAGGNDLKGVGVTLLAMSAAIAILAGVCVILGLVKTENLIKGIAAVTVLGILVTLMVSATKNAENVKGTMIGIAVAIGVMAGAIALLSFIDPVRLASAVVAMTIVMGIFALIENQSKNVTKSFGALIVMTVAIGMIAAVLKLLSTVPAEQSLGNAIALSAVLLAMSVSMKILNTVGEISKSVMGSMAVLLLVVAGIATILGVMSALNVAPSIETAASLSVMLIAMSVAVGILGAIAPLATAAIEGAGALVAVAGILTAAVIAFGAISQIPGADWLVSEGGEFLQKIGTAIGQFVGGIAGGVAEGATSTLPEVGSNLSAFMTNARPFLDGMSSIDESLFTSVQTLASAIALLTASSFLDSITSFITGGSSLVDFANQLVPFGQAIAAYSQTVAGVDAGAIQASAQAGQALAELATSLPKEGGLAQAIFGENQDMATFGTQLVAFGTAIKAYSLAIAGIDAEAISASAQAGQALSELAGSLPKEGGLAQAIFGENQDLSTFGTQLVTFGMAIKEYSASVSGLDVEAINTSVQAGEALTELANALPDDPGWIQTIFGGQDDLSGFGDKLASFGAALCKYSDSIGDLDIDKMTSSITAAEQVKTLAESLQDFDPSGIDNFNIGDLGQKLKDYNDRISEIEFGNLTTSIFAIQQLISMIGTMVSLDTSGIETFKMAVEELATVDLSGIAEKFSGAVPQFTAIGASLIDALLNGMRSRSGSVSGIMSELMGSIMIGLESARARCLAIGASIASALGAGIMSSAGSVHSSLASVISMMISNVQSRAAMFHASGLMLMLQFKMGLSAGGAGAVASLTRVLSNCVSSLRGYYGSFYSAGSYVASGFAAGIRAGAWQARMAAIAMANAAEQAARDALDINSPSKVFRKIGSGVPEGFIQGIERMGTAVYKATRSMGETAIDGMTIALSKTQSLASYVPDEIIPTISPVVDMSNVESGVAAINSMFSNDVLVGTNMNLNSISASMRRRNQNGANTEILSAINKLHGDLTNIERPSYNINGITYDDGTAVANAIETLVRAAIIERRM